VLYLSVSISSKLCWKTVRILSNWFKTLSY